MSVGQLPCFYFANIEQQRIYPFINLAIQFLRVEMDHHGQFSWEESVIPLQPPRGGYSMTGSYQLYKKTYLLLLLQQTYWLSAVGMCTGPSRQPSLMPKIIIPIVSMAHR